MKRVILCVLCGALLSCQPAAVARYSPIESSDTSQARRSAPVPCDPEPKHVYRASEPKPPAGEYVALCEDLPSGMQWRRPSDGCQSVTSAPTVCAAKDIREISRGIVVCVD